MKTQSVASYHPIIAELNNLPRYDLLEGEDLVCRCFEHGIFEWTNPKFLVFLKHTVEAYLYDEIGRRQLRGLMYARYAAEHMPPGVDDDIKRWMVAIAAGEPEPKLKKQITTFPGQPSNKVWTGPCCHWPSVRGNLWSQVFWVKQSRFVNGRLTTELRRRQSKLRRQQKEAS
ncbi:hypothetical protein [Leptothoe sp. PORK10 BA2]|uniref:hypothetical protein n=1 Tax=Leptothoe sp. PORK10 BA2 TaxID=3110254 RepID=UPI002B21EA53|nr:hypothetical protein [Leptothoe sp. PORK10 BA2]MEA5465295.1 hypothetical protein [Leptothoe sp. PORK10 BA2]